MFSGMLLFVASEARWSCLPLANCSWCGFCGPLYEFCRWPRSFLFQVGIEVNQLLQRRPRWMKCSRDDSQQYEIVSEYHLLLGNKLASLFTSTPRRELHQ